jgi:hypothetical protein
VTTAAEIAVRRYLAWIDDPDTAVDVAAIEAAEIAFAEATDPIAKLHAAAARERAATADVAAIEADFVAHAKPYAEANDIPASAFAALGVGPDVLARAGFAVVAGGRSAGSGSGGRTPSAGPRAPQVPMAKLKATALSMPKRFTLAQLAAQAGGGSPATVRKAVDELIAEGRVIKLGPAADHQGPGRAPMVYELR